MSVKNTGRKPVHWRQFITLGKRNSTYGPGSGPEPGSDEDIMIRVSARYETGSGFGDNTRSLCMEVLGTLPCIHSVPCPEHCL